MLKYWKNLINLFLFFPAVYLVHNITTALEPFTLSFEVKQDRQLLNPASWNITVSQLDCMPGGPTREVTTYNPALEIGPLNGLSRNFDTGYWLAPRGCLQYFPETSGQIRSLNYNNGVGPYAINLDYAICFRRTSETTKIRFTSTQFDMSRLLSANDVYDESCIETRGTTGVEGDYLFFPSATYITTTGEVFRANRFCASSLVEGAVEITPPGPIALHFHSDSVYRPTEIGFLLDYIVTWKYVYDK